MLENNMKVYISIVITLLLAGCAGKNITLEEYGKTATLNEKDITVVDGIIMHSGKPAYGVLKITEEGHSVTLIGLTNGNATTLIKNKDIVRLADMPRYVIENEIDYILGMNAELDIKNNVYTDKNNKSKINNGLILASQQKAEITTIAQINEGKLNGELKAFYFNFLYLEQQYSDGVKNGKGAYYTRSDQISKYTYKNGKLDGKKTYLGTQRDLRKEEFYNNGMLEIVKEYSNGQLRRITPHKEGKAEGRAIEYNSDGKAFGYIDYVNGKAEGVAEFKYMNDPKYKFYDINYTNGKKNGIMRYYYKDGSVAAEVNYKDDEIILPYTGYKPDGTVKYKYINKDESYCTDAGGNKRRMFNDNEKKYSISGLIVYGACND